MALGFGAGLSPKAPGTVGTLAAIPIVILVSLLGHHAYLSILIAGFILGVYVCGKTATDVQHPDHGAIVWDEIIGFMITMLFIPITWQSLLLGFALFRFFDIVKPWPISWLDKNVHAGLGIMLDDVAAGIAAWLVLFFTINIILP